MSNGAQASPLAFTRQHIEFQGFGSGLDDEACQDETDLGYTGCRYESCHDSNDFLPVIRFQFWMNLFGWMKDSAWNPLA